MPDSSRITSRGQALAGILHEARQGAGLGYDDLSARSGVRIRTLYRYFAGDVGRPDPTKVSALCTALNVDGVETLRAIGYLPAAAAVAA